MKRINGFDKIISVDFEKIKTDTNNKMKWYILDIDQINTNYKKNLLKEEELVLDNKDDINLDDMLRYT